eukprot:493282_1
MLHEGSLKLYQFFIHILKNVNLSMLLSIYLLSYHVSVIASTPSAAPTPSCLTLYVTVTDQNDTLHDTNYSVDNFDGLYTLSNKKQFERPVYEVQQSPNTQNIRYYFGTSWIINGIGHGNMLSYESNVYFPPINNTNAKWTHASLGGIFYVHIKCIDSYSPTWQPTDSIKNITIEKTELEPINIIFIVNITFIALCILIIMLICKFANTRYYHILMWMVSAWLIINCILYTTWTFLIYFINFMHSLYTYYRYKKHLYANDPTVNRITKIIQLVSCVFCGVVPSLYLFKSKFYRIDIFSLGISSRFISMLFYDIVFMLFHVLRSIAILFTANSVFFIQNEWREMLFSTTIIFIWCFTIVFIIYEFYLLFTNYKYQHKEHHSVLTLKIVFDGNSKTKSLISTSKHQNYEKQLTLLIQQHINSTRYLAEVTKIIKHNTKNTFLATISVQFNDNKEDVVLNMEKELQFCFVRDVSTFLSHNTSKLADISKLANISVHDQGTYEKENIFKFYLHKSIQTRQSQLKKLENNLNKYDKALLEMKPNDITQIVIYWLLSDRKYQMFSDEITRILTNKNIDAIFINELLAKAINVKVYFNNLISDYIGYQYGSMDNIINALSMKVQTNVTMNSYTVSQFINNFIIDTLQSDPLVDSNNNLINGKWIVNNIENEKFQNMLQIKLGIDEDDAKQIHKFLTRYRVPQHVQILSKIKDELHSNLYQYIYVSNLDEIIDDIFCINYKKLALKLRNNSAIHEETEAIANLLSYLVMDNNKHNKSKLNLGLISKIYCLYGEIFSELFLKEWYCSNCNYFNRIVKINGDFIKPNDKLMQNCLVCGCDKIQSIANALKGKSIQAHFVPNINQQDDIFCTNQNEPSECLASETLLEFMNKYSQNKNQLNYTTILSTLTEEQMWNHVFLQAISNIANQIEQELLLELFKSELSLDINNYKMARLSEWQLIEIIHNKCKQIKSGTIKTLYKLILNQMDQYVLEQRIKILGTSYIDLIAKWKHVAQIHLDISNSDSLEYFSAGMDKCDKSQCEAINKKKQKLKINSNEQKYAHEDYN